jgi:hypothetical protein
VGGDLGGTATAELYVARTSAGASLYHTSVVPPGCRVRYPEGAFGHAWW